MTSRMLKVGIVQMAVSEDIDANLSKAGVMVAEAGRMGAEVVCLPELFAWRYFPAEKGVKAEPQGIPGRVSAALSSWAKGNRLVLVGGSIYESDGKDCYNTSLVYDDRGDMISKYRKVHLPQDDHYYEQDYFKSGDSYSVAKSRGITIGSLICFDQWYPEAARVVHLMGADILFYPTAIGWVKGIAPDEGDWKAAWESVQVGHAIANSMVVCAVNRVGIEGDTEFWGGSFVCDQFGKVLFRAGDEEGTHVVTIDLGLSERVEKGWGFMRNRKKRTYSRIVQ